MSDIFARGHKCMFKGQKIVGDGEHTRIELYNKVMAAKIRKKRGQNVAETVTQIDPQTSNSASQDEPENLPKPKPKKKVKKKK